MATFSEPVPTQSFDPDDASASLSGEGETTLTSGPRDNDMGLTSRGPLTTSDLGWQIGEGLVMAVMIVAVMLTLVFFLSPS